MSKKYKHKTCVYCAREGTSDDGDHVISRKFFNMNDRSNLPKVPACRNCNVEKSKLEHYLTAILPLGARHCDDVTGYWIDSRARLEKNQKLQKELASGTTLSHTTTPDGKQRVDAALPFHPASLLQLAQWIAKGLLYEHSKNVVPPEHPVNAQFMNREVERSFGHQLAALKSLGARVVGSVETTGLQTLGNGAFTYEGFYSQNDRPFSLWRFNFYDIVLGFPESTETTSSVIALIPPLNYEAATVLDPSGV